MNYWVLLAVLFVLGLMGIAAYYHVLLYRHKKRQAASADEFKKEIEKRRERGVQSIVILSRAVLAEQVSLTEASIRINALSILLMDKALIEELSVFRQLAEATAHIPILEEWKKLPTKDKLAYDREREKIEETFKDFVMVTADRIANQGMLSKTNISEINTEQVDSVVKEFKP
ncbi:hypothetical protein TDB9533_01193 [Thalassocella blandensis]|nr:hypothetical protein TDB9533_01193 [Thalassocella blandensis]